ncbi:MAG: hypothetical protein A2539_07610 [Elusimicrobia bacterium RIFOXYD2_FULL_34_15]|nr:MAG: hypothetical protein A2539_07610 [Elusimicrobia bacterium RIFOXYD2_FULL_34_15]
MNYFNYIGKSNLSLKKLEVTGYNKKRMEINTGFGTLLFRTLRLKKDNGQIFFIGNGASASMSSHTALDMWKNANIRAQSFNDMVSITAISNDIAYKEVFSKPLDFFVNKSDMLVCISSSGNSENIVNAVKLAKKKDLFIVTFSAMNKNNKLRYLGDINFYIPAQTYGFAESGHQLLLHYWIDNLVNLL